MVACLCCAVFVRDVSAVNFNEEMSIFLLFVSTTTAIRRIHVRPARFEGLTARFCEHRGLRMQKLRSNTDQNVRRKESTE